MIKAHSKVGKFSFLSTQKEGKDPFGWGGERGSEALVSTVIFVVLSPNSLARPTDPSDNGCLWGGLGGSPAASQLLHLGDGGVLVREPMSSFHELVDRSYFLFSENKTRNEDFYPGKCNYLWLRKVDGLSRDLRNIIKESRRRSNDSVNVIYLPHQLNKFVVSYRCKYFHKPEDLLPEIVGNVS